MGSPRVLALDVTIASLIALGGEPSPVDSGSKLLVAPSALPELWTNLPSELLKHQHLQCYATVVAAYDPICLPEHSLLECLVLEVHEFSIAIESVVSKTK